MSHAAPISHRPPLLLGVLLTLWLLAAIAVGATGALARLPVPPPAIALGLTAALLLLLWASPPFRGQVRSLGMGPLVGFHIVRLLAGVYFLLLWSAGVLPGSFAIGAGYGDILVGVGAAVVLWRCVPARTEAQLSWLLIWNVVGLLDIVLVLVNAVRLLLPDPAMGVPFTTLPLALLPTFVVPLVLSTHLVIFAFARASRL